MRTIKTGTAWTVALTLAAGLAGCKSSTTPNQPANIVDTNNGVDPASVNMAPVDPSAPVQTSYAVTPSGTSTNTKSRVLDQRSQYPAGQAQGEDYPQQQTSDDPAYDQYQASVDAGQAALYANDAPPPLPVYEQPELTQANDQWTPGYWGYGNGGGYYWVPGAWVAPPYAGGLWTPGYWGYEGNRYRFHHGFWGRHIGFYGGVSYGFGYFGHGYEGGYWNNNNFYYNRQVNRVNAADVHNVYVRNVTVVNSRVSYNGPGGYNVRPQPAELAVYHEQRLPPMQVQRQQMQAAATNRQQFFSANHGAPAVMVNPRAEADHTLPRPIQPIQRGGFGQPGGPPAQRTQAAAPQNGPQNVQQQRIQAVEQHNAQEQQRTQAIQQHNVQAQQHNVQEQQRTQALQQRNVEAQQQRTQQMQQRQAQMQQHAAQQAAPRAQPQVQARPEPAARPVPQARPEAAPRPVQQPQARPEPAPRAAQPAPQPRAQPAPQPHPQPAAQPRGNEHPRR